MARRQTVEEKIAEAARTSATTLYLSFNQLTSLPESLGILTSLNGLSLSFNQLTSLPEWLGNLTSLTYLDLSGNQLTSLPESLGNLTSLTTLNLRANGLTSLPEWLGNLTSLRGLSLSDNGLTSLPEWLGNLTSLRGLDLRGNPLQIPSEIVDDWENAPRILKYLADLKKGTKRPLNEAKMVLVGEAKNGKTSLGKRLRGLPFEADEGKTDGIDILQWHFTAGERDIRLNVWDLGGQEIYHATHQFFLTERTLYVLVLNSRQTEVQNRLDYWLKTIRTLGKDAPILVVQNHYETNPHELNRKQLKEKYPTIQGFYQTSCAPETEKGIDELKTAIQEIVAAMPHVCDEVPGAYFRVKERLEQDQRDFLPYEAYQTVCNEEGLDDPESQKILIRLLHELGIMLNFQEDHRVRDTSVLNPEWVTEGVYKIIDFPALRAAKDAILRLGMLDTILPLARYPLDKRRYIVEMMAKFELGFERNERGDWLIPELLAPEEPEDTGDFTDALRFEYHYDFLPASVLPRFIVRTHTFRQTYFWRDGVVLEDGGNQARVRADIDDKKIKIEINGRPNTRRDLLAKIRGHFAHIHDTLQGMDYEEMIPIPKYPGAKPVPYSFLLEMEEKKIERFPHPGVKDLQSVADLLNGIESNRTRTAERKREEPKPEPAEVKTEKTVETIDEALKTIDAIAHFTDDNLRYLKELARVVQENKLVPFVGAGMSYPVGLKLWGEALEAIYQQAKPSLTVDHAMAFGGARATKQLPEAAQVLWEAMGDKWFNDRIKALFGKDTLSTAKITAAPVSLLPQLASGPVLTTNFDPILERVYSDFTDMILGDYRADQILNNFDDKKHFLLKLHGDADESQGRVLTKAQYDRAYDEAGGSRLPDLLRAIFSSRRPLLFLGCSLEMDRTVTELQKAGLQLHNAYHFALLPDPGEAERTRRHNDLVGKLGIKPIWLRDFNDIRLILEFLVRVRGKSQDTRP